LSITIPLRRGAGGGSPELRVGRNIEVHLPQLLKEPLLVPAGELAGWSPADLQFRADLGEAWKRVPGIQALPSHPSSGRYELALLFKRPQILPKPRATGYQTLSVTRRAVRAGIRFDVVYLQVDDLESAGRILTGEGFAGYDSFAAAMRAVVGVEEDPMFAKRLLAKRSAERRSAFRKVRLWLLLTSLAISVGPLVERPSIRSAIAGVIIFGMILTLMATFAGVYRLVRFHLGAPQSGRKHRSVMSLLTPIFVAGLAAMLALAKACPCSDVDGLRLAAEMGWILWTIAGILTLYGHLGMRATDAPQDADGSG
jgi:hypothetical protein